MSELPRNQEIENSTYPIYPENDTEQDIYDEDIIKKLEKKTRWRRKLALRLSAIALATATISNAYWADVQDNQAEQNAAEISLNVIAGPINEANSRKATVFIDGFNSYDADFLAGNLGPAVQQVADGELWSLGYNNGLLSRNKIYEIIVDTVEERNIDSISVVGYSMGGIIGAEATADVVKKSDLPVNSLIMVSTPDGSEGVRPYQKEELNFMQWLTEWVPGAIDSSWFRFAGEVYFYRDNYLTGNPIKDTGSFFRTFGSAAERLNDPRATSLQLLSQQVYKVDRFNMLDELKTIADQRNDKQMPVLLYLGTGEPGYDTVVDDKVSAADFAQYTKETEINYLSYLVPGAIHSHYYDTPDAYMQIFGEASTPMAQDLQSELGRRASRLFAQQIMQNKATSLFALTK